MHADKLAYCAIESAKITIASEGHLIGLVVVHANGTIRALPYKDGSMPVGVQQQVIIGVVKGVRKLGVFEGLVMVSEAWVAEQTNPALEGVLRPSLYPDRKEIVIVYAYGDDGSRRMLLAPIIRADGKVSLGPPDVREEQVQSWLDDAFKD